MEEYLYEVKVFIPDDNGGTYTFYSRYADCREAAMESVAEDNPDVAVVSAFRID